MKKSSLVLLAVCLSIPAWAAETVIKQCKVTAVTHDRSGKSMIEFEECSNATGTVKLEITTGFENMVLAVSQALIWNLRVDVAPNSGKVDQITLRPNAATVYTGY